MDLFLALLFTFFSLTFLAILRHSWSAGRKGCGAYYGALALLYTQIAASMWLEVFWLTTGNSPEALIPFFTLYACFAGRIVWFLRTHLRVGWVHDA